MTMLKEIVDRHTRIRWNYYTTRTIAGKYFLNKKYKILLKK